MGHYKTVARNIRDNTLRYRVNVNSKQKNIDLHLLTNGHTTEIVPCNYILIFIVVFSQYVIDLFLSFKINY